MESPSWTLLHETVRKGSFGEEEFGRSYRRPKTRAIGVPNRLGGKINNKAKDLTISAFKMLDFRTGRVTGRPEKFSHYSE